MRKIALLTPGFGETGGVASVTEFLYRYLNASRGFSATVVSVPMSWRSEANVKVSNPASWLRGVRKRGRQVNGVEFTEVGAFLAELEFQRYRPRRRLTEELKRYDVVQVVGGSPAWGYLTRDLPVPVAVQAATLVARERRSTEDDNSGLWSKLMTKAVQRIERLVISEVADAIMVENSWMYQCLRKRESKGRVVFAPPGVDTSLYRPCGPSIKNSQYILSVGRFSDTRKNVRLLFRAYKALWDMRNDAPTLVLAGAKGPSNDQLMLAEELGIRNHVSVRTGVTDEELAALYRGAEVFVLSSNQEGLGLVIAEAMASGTPVVATNCGGPSVLIDDGESGFLVPVGEPRPLAKRINQLLENREIANRLGRKGRNRIEESFSYAAAGRRFSEVYDTILLEAGKNQ